MRKEGAWRDARVAAEYERRRFATPLQRQKHRRDATLVLRLLRRAGAAGRVLDVPCGTGRLMPALAAAGNAVVGADVSLAMLGRRPLAAGAAVQASAVALPFRDAAFDAVVCMRFLFHVEPGPERAAMLSELGRVGGVVVGQVRHRSNVKQASRWARSRVGLCRRYRPSRSTAAIERELGEAGLELVELVPVSRLFSDKALFVARR